MLTLFAIALVPILALTGGLIDYTQAANARIQLNAAADSAALAAVSQAAMLKSIADSKADAEKIFDANAASYKSMLASRTVEITNVGLSRSAKVVYSANYPTQFASFVGQGKVVVSGTSSAAGARAPFIDFFLLLDNSPSMGVAATDDDIKVMQANTISKTYPFGCAFACHDLDNPKNFYNKAKELGVQMRIDVVRTASQQLMDTAKNTATLTKQYRMAAYTMGPSCKGKKLTTIQSITDNLDAAKTAANAIDLMTIPTQNFDSDQCTDFNKTLTDMNAAIDSRAMDRRPLHGRRCFISSPMASLIMPIPYAPRKIRHDTLPGADQCELLQGDQGSRHQDRGALHDLSAPADEPLVQ